MSLAREIAFTALLVYFLLLLFRVIMDYVFMFARSFRPQGVLAMALELTYTATDPPINAMRKVLPPLRIGNVALDLAITIVILVTYILMTVVQP